MKRQLFLKISGKVQRVFFRAETQEKARKLELTGFVRNTDDDGVEVLAQGEEAQLCQFLEWCKKGPPRAKVNNVETQWKKPTEDFTEFAIKG